MAASAYPHGFTATLDTTDSGAWPDIVQVIKADLEKIGIDLKINEEPIGKWVGEIFGPKTYGPMFSDCGTLNPDPSGEPDYLLGSANVKAGGFDFADYAPKSVDELLARSVAASNPSTAARPLRRPAPQACGRRTVRPAVRDGANYVATANGFTYPAPEDCCSSSSTGACGSRRTGNWAKRLRCARDPPPAQAPPARQPAPALSDGTGKLRPPSGQRRRRREAPRPLRHRWARDRLARRRAGGGRRRRRTAIEVGIPFSDPMIDGPTSDREAFGGRALRAGATPAGIVRALGGADVDVPLVVMTYDNILERAGHVRLASVSPPPGSPVPSSRTSPSTSSTAGGDTADAAGVESRAAGGADHADDRLRTICERTPASSTGSARSA